MPNTQDNKTPTDAESFSPANSTGESERYWKGAYEKSAQDDAQASGFGSNQNGTKSPRSYYGPTNTSDDAEKRARQAAAVGALKRKDRAAAALFAIFLGVFGIHKFYLGYNKAGFIMLAVSIIGSIISFGLAALVVEVISIIEGIIYLTRSQTEFDRIYVLNQREWF